MMRNRTGTLLVLAVVAGGLAAFLALRFLRDVPVPGVADRHSGEVIQVAVAARDMDVGTRIGPGDVRTIAWPGESLPVGYSTSIAALVGRGLLTPVRMNEPVLLSKLAHSDAGAGLSILIPEGMRAVSVRVDEVVGVAGFIRPGARVDVLVTLDRVAQQSEPQTQVVLQNLEVLAAGQSIERDGDGNPQSVPVMTLLVNPDQAEKLALASTNGRIQMALRNALDLEEVQTPGIRVSRLFQSPTPAPVAAAPVRARPPPPPSRFEVEVYRGPERSTSTVENRPPPPVGAGDQ